MLIEILVALLIIASLLYFFRQLYIRYQEMSEAMYLRMQLRIQEKQAMLLHGKLLKQKEEKNKIIEKPKVYQLNCSSVRLNLYSSDLLDNYYIKKIYEEIVLKNYLLQEPLYSLSFRLLSIVDKSQLFTMSPKSKIIKMNIRNEDGILEHSKSFKVVAITEISYRFLMEIYRDIITLVIKDEKQIIIISLLIWLISKSYKVQIKYEKSDNRELFDLLLEILAKEYKAEIFDCLKSQDYFDNNIVILNAYEKAIYASHEYPFAQKDFEETIQFRIRSKLEKEKIALP